MKGREKCSLSPTVNSTRVIWLRWQKRKPEVRTPATQVPLNSQVRTNRTDRKRPWMDGTEIEQIRKISRLFSAHL